MISFQLFGFNYQVIYTNIAWGIVGSSVFTTFSCAL